MKEIVKPQKTWPEISMELGFKMRDLFKEDNMAFITCMVQGTGIPHILNDCYRVLIRKNKLVEMEKLPVEEKQRLFDIVKDFSTADFTKEKYITSCKALYALEYFLINPSL